MSIYLNHNEIIFIPNYNHYTYVPIYNNIPNQSIYLKVYWQLGNNRYLNNTVWIFFLYVCKNHKLFFINNI